jgi:hypothetical protein
MNATKNVTSNITSAPKPVEKNVTKAVNITKNNTHVVQTKSKAMVKSSIHAAVQNMKNALQPTDEIKQAVLAKKPENKKFTNRENVGRSLESMINSLEGSIVDDKPAPM